jgi:beta-N-acetylhexosaminidase
MRKTKKVGKVKSKSISIPRHMKKEWKLFYVLLLITLLLGTLNVAQAKGYFVPNLSDLWSDNVDEENVIHLDNLTLEQKIAQMVITHGGTHNREAWQRMQLGGIHLFAMESEELFTYVINDFQEGMTIPFFVTADLEGCWNPFANFYDSVSVSDINSTEDAYQKGLVDGELLSRMGFTINFAPVVDLDDKIWGCRSFPGDEQRISELAESYIFGIQEQGLIATAKHYPGKTLVVLDPHQELVVAEIESEDLYPYEYLSTGDRVRSFMVSHIIAFGDVHSQGIPSVVSSDIIGPLKEDYSGLIISDDTMMLGLRNFYDDVDQLYVDVFAAGNDLVINFDEDPNEIYRMITVVEEAVNRGEISEEQIDNSVRKILTAKGFVVK